MAELLFKDEVYATIGAAMEVYNTLGPGFLEAVYQEALAYEFAQHSIQFVAQKEISVFYGPHQLNAAYIADFLVYDKIIIEIKALNQLTSREESQLLNYLKAPKLQLGLLINFGCKEKLEWKRMINTRQSFANDIRY
jgi:GxxExxY protein